MSNPEISKVTIIVETDSNTIISVFHKVRKFDLERIEPQPYFENIGRDDIIPPVDAPHYYLTLEPILEPGGSLLTIYDKKAAQEAAWNSIKPEINI